jgi:hypothetical protein
VKIETLPRPLPQFAGDALRVELVKALDYLAAHGTAADKASFNDALRAAQIINNENVFTTPVALAARAAILVSTTVIDIILDDQYIEPTRAIDATQFTVNNGGTVSSVALVAPDTLRITGTGYANADVVSYAADSDVDDVLRFSNWVAAASDATLGPAVGAATLTMLGAVVEVESTTQIRITLRDKNVGRAAFGAFAVDNGGTVTGVSYPNDHEIVLTGTGYAAGDIVTYTNPGDSTSLLADRGYAVYTIATGAAPAAV